MIAVEHNKETVLQAIKRLGHKVSAADIAASTGLPLSAARLTLNQIALDTSAVLDVTSAGDISYKFISDLESVYRINGIKKLLYQTGKILFEIGFFLLRISFGILLIASFVTIALVFLVALIFILCGIGAADAADGNMGMGGHINFGFYDFADLGNFFSWRTFSGLDSPSADDYYQEIADPNDRGFFQNCFSFLFGDGNPNKKLQQTQWQLLAECIRRNHGVVTAEQLAPYMMDNRTDAAAMLAVMVRFEGTPEATPSGNLIYCFPSLQITAAGLKDLMDLPVKLQENEWKFSSVPVERLHWVFFFAGANLCGAYALIQHLSWVQPLVPYVFQIQLLFIYAVFFMCFPMLRELCNTVLNSFVERRNNIRTKSVSVLASPETTLRIQEARQFAVRALNLRSQSVLYTTAQNILEQDTDGLAQEFKELPADDRTGEQPGKDPPSQN